MKNITLFSVAFLTASSAVAAPFSIEPPRTNNYVVQIAGDGAEAANIQAKYKAQLEALRAEAEDLKAQRKAEMEALRASKKAQKEQRKANRPEKPKKRS